MKKTTECLNQRLLNQEKMTYSAKSFSTESVFNGPFKMISFKMSFSTKQTKIFVNSGFSTGSTTAV